jgi:hypothetical protein
MSTAGAERASLASAGLRPKRRATSTAVATRRFLSITGRWARPVLPSEALAPRTFLRAPHPQPPRAARRTRTARAEPTADVTRTFLHLPSAPMTSASPIRIVRRRRHVFAVARPPTTPRTPAYPGAIASLTRTVARVATARRHHRHSAGTRRLTTVTPPRTRASTTPTAPRSTRGPVWRPGPVFVRTTCKRSIGHAAPKRFAPCRDPDVDLPRTDAPLSVRGLSVRLCYGGRLWWPIEHGKFAR